MFITFHIGSRDKPTTHMKEPKKEEEEEDKTIAFSIFITDP